MLYSEDEVIKAIQAVAQGMKLKKEVQQVICREDYQDYQIVLDGTHHCEIREKVIDLYMKNQDKESLKEIKFQLQHPAQYSEWERLDAQKREEKDKEKDIIIDETGGYEP